MSQKTSADYLRDILNELADVAAFTESGQAAFMVDIKTQKAVIRSYEVIGEIAKRLPQTLRDQHPEIDWRRLMNFRDFLAHNYDLVLIDRLWIAVEDLPILQAAIEAIVSD